MKNTPPLEMADDKVVELCGIKVRAEKQEEINAAHCRTPKQALAKARKLNKQNDRDEYVAVRVTTTVKTEVLKETK